MIQGGDLALQAECEGFDSLRVHYCSEKIKTLVSNNLWFFTIFSTNQKKIYFASQSKSSDWTGLKIREAAGGTQGRH